MRPRARVRCPATPAAWRGFALHLSRQDGSRAAHAAVLTRMAGGVLTALVVVAPAADAALRHARDVVARQG